MEEKAVEKKRNPFIPTYSDEEKSFMVELMTKHMDKKGKPSFVRSIADIEEKRPGLLRAKTTASKSLFLANLWKKMGPRAILEQKFDNKIAELNHELKREDLIGMMKIKAQEFMLRDYDSLKPSEKFKIVGEVIKADYNEEKLQMEKDKLRANKRMMDNLMGSLMSGDKNTILSKYEIKIAAPQNLITLNQEEDEDGDSPIATAGDAIAIN